MMSADRNHPFIAHIKERHRLSSMHSTRDMFHIILNAPLPYRPGDYAVIWPSNPATEVDALMQRFPEEFREFFTQKANLQKIHPALLKAAGESFGAASPVELVAQHPSLTLSDVKTFFLPLLPRFYSIASSSRVDPNEIHLLVAQVSYEANHHKRYGVASRFLCHDAIVNETPIPLYIQPSRNFSLPEDPRASIILVGAGCGLAPYRGFLQERIATNAAGRNWLFFGERHSGDFYFEEFWRSLQNQDRLRLNLAFSREENEKAYVQDRMWEERRNLWAWIEEGAFIYVCGNPKMGRDVEEVLLRIAVNEGGLSKDAAEQKIKSLRTEKRYRADVY